MSNKTKDTFEYEGGDLEAMMLAEQYYRWISHKIKPYIGKHVVEVGAGVGSFSRMIKEANPKTLTLIEPSKKMHAMLKNNIITTKRTKVTTYNNYLKNLKTKLKKEKPDTFVYINVFEHIKDDTSEIKHIAELLNPGGNAVIFVPALQALYSNFDKSIDHYRRYSKKQLEKLCEESGLEVVDMRYMDIVGILPWWFSFRLMKRTSLVPFLVKAYDSMCVPIIRAIEERVPAPVGKNLLLIARKPK